MAQTKKPTGLTLTRKGLKFVCQWDIADADYKDGQHFERFYIFEQTVNPVSVVGGGSGASTANSGTRYEWGKASLGAKDKKRVLTLPESHFYPHTDKRLVRVMFSIKGNRKSYKKDKKTINPTWSDESRKSFDINPPKKPKLTASWDSQTPNATTFVATIDGVDDSNHSPFTRMVAETMLIQNASSVKGSDFKWNSTQTGYHKWTTTSKTYTVPVPTETITPTRANSWTRFVRVRAEGIGGESAWTYAYHVYGVPSEPDIVSPKTVENKKPTGDITLDVTFRTPSSASHPIDSGGITLEYAIVTPSAGLTMPSESFSEAGSRSNTKGNDRFYYDLGQPLPLDKCLFIRAKVKHDTYEEHSNTYLRYVGYLPQPTQLTAQFKWTTRKVEVTATNSSEIEDSFLVVMASYVNGDSNTRKPIGIIPHGSTSAIINLPTDAPEGATRIGVYAAVGTWTGSAVKAFSGKVVMRSDGIQWASGSLRPAPDGFTAVKAPVEDTAELSWQWTWAEADQALITWADNPVAWESNDEPSEYTVSALNQGHWYITGIEEGKTWYFRMRLGKTVGEEVQYGDWTEIVPLDLRSAPNKPNLVLSETVIPSDGIVTAYWAYVTTDGTPQSRGEICEAHYEGTELIYGNTFAETTTEQHIDVSATERGWQEGEDYLLCVRVQSQSGVVSESWSDPVAVHIAAKPTAVIASDNLTVKDMEVETEGEYDGTEYWLESLPLRVTVTGAGEGTTTVAIARAEDFAQERPDESTITGHKGETVALISQKGEAEITIDSVVGYLDDGAWYNLVATVTDAYGQSDTVTKPFVVHWSHQAAMPNGEVFLDGLVAVMIPREPTDVPDGWQMDVDDRVDIYRLSADKPELIVPDAEIGVAYVDPYPAIGGGYRFVYKTKFGDYIIEPNDDDAREEDGQIAFLDIESGFEHDSMIVDFGGETAELYYNVDEDDDWSKDFLATTYMGGRIVGDWNPAVEHTADINAVVITVIDEDVVTQLRRLAEYVGAVHVRTLSGSSYTANVDVKRSRNHSHYGTRYSYSLSITKVDQEGYDGITLAEYQRGTDGDRYMDFNTNLGYLVDEQGRNILDDSGDYIVVETGEDDG